MKNLLTVIYYTSNQEEEAFEDIIKAKLLEVAGDLPLISVSPKTHFFWKKYLCWRSRSVHCIIVSGLTRKWVGNACSDLGSVRGYFRDWQEIKLIQGINQEGDPSPRPKMYGVLFKGALTKMSIEGILGRWRETIKPVDGVVVDTLSPVYGDFYRRVLSRKPFDFKDVPYYQFLKKNNPHQDTEKYMARKKALALDIQKNGLKVPPFIDRNETIIDGLSRIFIMKRLGHKNTFVRKM